MEKVKKIVAIDLSTTGKGGGPYNSTKRIINSKLKDIYDFKIISYDNSLGRFISLRRIYDLYKQLKTINPDIVHFTGLQLSGFHIILACKMAGIKKTILTIRGMSGDSIYFNPLKKFILTYIIEPLTLMLVSKFYSVSEYISKRRIPSLFDYKSEGYIYNFPKGANLNDQNTPILETVKDFLANGDVVVLSVARINREKGYHILEEAIHQLDDIKNIKFIIAGDGEYLQTMKTNLSEQVKSKKVLFTGYVSDPSVLYSQADIFVLPTLHETLSLVLLEASLHGISLIASNTGGIPEIIEQDVNGDLVKVGDAQDIEKAIRKQFYNPKLRKIYGKNSLEKVKSKFNENQIADKIAKIYERV